MCLHGVYILKADPLFIKCQHQQNTPPSQEADVLQQKHQPGSLVTDVHHGGKLETGVKIKVSSYYLSVVYHLYTVV